MENNEQRKQEYMNLNFFKLIWYSITKFEKYPEMAALGVKKAVIYFTKIMVIFSIVFTVFYAYNINHSGGEETAVSTKVINQLLDNYEYEDDQRELLMNTLTENMGNSIFVVLFISAFVSIYLSTLLDVFTLSIFGLLTCIVAKIKIKYKAVFNMSIYAITLSIILRMIYSGITILTEFRIKYFDIMYTAISYIILAAAIFMIKSDVIKQQLQLMKIIEEGKEKIEQTINIPKRQKEDEDDKEPEKEKNEKEDKTKDTGGEQGSNA